MKVSENSVDVRRDRRASACKKSTRAVVLWRRRDGLIRFGTGAGKGRLARCCLQTYRPRRRMPGTADRGNNGGTRTWRAPPTMSGRPEFVGGDGALLRETAVTSNEK